MKVPFLLVAWLLSLHVLSQPKPLQPGDTLPTNVLASITAYQQPETSPELVEGHLIILDFWATWCTACIKGFEKLQALERQFPQLKVILVNAASTGDTEEKIKAFAAKRFPAGLPFPSVSNDSILKQFFPHELLPHYVWLRNGRVEAITGADELTAANIQAALRQDRFHLPVKNDFLLPDWDKSVFLRPNPHFTSALLPRQQGYPSLYRLAKDSSGKTYRIFFSNTTLARIFFIAFAKPGHFNTVSLHWANGLAPDHQVYCYEAIWPSQPDLDGWYMVQQDLVNRFGATARIRKKKTNCWLLLSSRRKPITATPACHNHQANHTRLQEKPVSTIISYLEKIVSQPVLDKTGFKYRSSFCLPLAGSVEEIQQALQKAGFRFKKARRKITSLILTNLKEPVVENFHAKPY